MVTDKQDLWFAALEEENNERLAQLEEAMQAKDKLHEINAVKIRKKAKSAAEFKAKHPKLSFMKRYNVIIIMILFLFITVAFNIYMFIR
ncbi:hypothetical protein [Moritella viscosa]|uniref:Uncharacterized protein n=1 Tax=Moritella viscosa TaxID=80854 RepID=A0A090IB94_9GAMM|nr:hypothetical protein [Moritella viscosa]CED59051.1 putative uncharacterized protein [Moritella viscosa]SGZ04283.1 Putative uncharacterized protein [Moritella viscosa]SGZ07108.1 Putative uncharacterized protein [Moritella viscosa]SGZ08164.1 Putative uncharacterized protein [Moritella viscosa]SGZ17254.1 Putative uncharacterized protein [Moritella viscosa]